MTLTESPLSQQQSQLVQDTIASASHKYEKYLQSSEIDDLFQAAFLRVMKFVKLHPDVLENMDRLRGIAWLSARRVAWERSREKIHDRRQRAELAVAHIRSEDYPPYALEEQQRFVREALLKLPPELHHIFELRAQGLRMSEIAARLKISKQAVCELLSRGVIKLRETLLEDGFEF